MPLQCASKIIPRKANIMKRILLTGGPTNEAIDQVMTITNMSTGSLSCDLAARALSKGNAVTCIFHQSVLRSAKLAGYGLAENPNCKLVSIDSCQDMYNALKAEGESGEKYDVVIHAAAVGDYKADFTFRMEDMAKEIAEKLGSKPEGEGLAEYILGIMTNPECKVKDDSKISSYEPNLTTKLTLTTKLISNLKAWFPGALLIGCKLLENVSKEELIAVATRLCNKNNMDYIMANDLAEIRAGRPVRYLVNKGGFAGTALNTPDGPALLDYAEENWF